MPLLLVMLLAALSVGRIRNCILYLCCFGALAGRWQSRATCRECTVYPTNLYFNVSCETGVNSVNKTVKFNRGFI